nr:hypothetical protein [Candidatus Brachybacter algidus]
MQTIVKKRWMQRYANKIIGGGTSRYFFAFGCGGGFQFAAIGGTTIAAIVMDR